MGKNMRMNFFKQRITIVLLLVVGIYSSINEFYFFGKDYYEYLLNTFAGITLLTGIAYLCYPKKKANLENELVLNEYKLVSLLGKYAGRVLTYDFIIRQLWGPKAKSDNQILRVNMANIRRKIEENPADPKYIFTEMGVGYRMAEGE